MQSFVLVYFCLKHDAAGRCARAQEESHHSSTTEAFGVYGFTGRTFASEYSYEALENKDSGFTPAVGSCRNSVFP